MAETHIKLALLLSMLITIASNKPINIGQTQVPSRAVAHEPYFKLPSKYQELYSQMHKSLKFTKMPAYLTHNYPYSVEFTQEVEWLPKCILKLFKHQNSMKFSILGCDLTLYVLRMSNFMRNVELVAKFDLGKLLKNSDIFVSEKIDFDPKVVELMNFISVEVTDQYFLALKYKKSEFDIIYSLLNYKSETLNLINQTIQKIDPEHKLAVLMNYNTIIYHEEYELENKWTASVFYESNEGIKMVKRAENGSPPTPKILFKGFILYQKTDHLESTTLLNPSFPFLYFPCDLNTPEQSLKEAKYGELEFVNRATDKPEKVFISGLLSTKNNLIVSYVLPFGS